MHVAFRVDSSKEIGIGHVMRCLTLAEELRTNGAVCKFICRNHLGNINCLIRERGFTVTELPFQGEWKANRLNPAHANWLGLDWQTDVDQTKGSIGEELPDWIVVDHYGVDAKWEQEILSHCNKIMVIDDLADRPHVCDLLLDQTLGRNPEEYRSLVPMKCGVLCGSQYALLRPEFAALRPYSLIRRAQPNFREILITMGGIDINNTTGRVLQILRDCCLPTECRFTVVMGSTAPWCDEVKCLAKNMPWPTRVVTNIKNMAQLMANADLAIGAAGTTSWERCCLGLPAAMIVLAENQRRIADALCKAGAALLVENLSLEFQGQLTLENLNNLVFGKTSAAAASITDGLGTLRVKTALSRS